MTEYEERGAEIRALSKTLILHYMRRAIDCRPDGAGSRQAQIFRSCGFDWGEYEKATSSSQQYWIVAALRELEAEGKVEQVASGGPWRLK